jgi:hypothetical protein
MPQNTNLNVNPYYDDFDAAKNYYKVLFRPGYPIQARELTTMQSILQNQIENMGQHFFKEGAMVIPGQVGYDLDLNCILVQPTFLGSSIEAYRESLHGKTISGVTSGVKAKVLFSIDADTSERDFITFYVKYLESGDTNRDRKSFLENEQLVCESDITFSSNLIEAGSPFAQLIPTNALGVGSAAYINQGVYFIRGFLVDVPSEYIILDQYDNNPTYRIGLEISESIITSEDDASLNDNSVGTSNYSAPGAHRLKLKTTLVKKIVDDDADQNFIELLRLNQAKVEQFVDKTAYSEIEKTIALRTYEESGDYVVNDFDVRVRESLNDGFNDGVFTSNQKTSQEAIPSDDLYAIEVGPGVGYVRGYRTETLIPKYIDLLKPRDYNSIQNGIVPFELGNYFKINNLWGSPQITGTGITTNSYNVIELRDLGTVTKGNAAGNLIGYARAVSIEYDSTASTFNDPSTVWKLYIMDAAMFTIINTQAACTIALGSQVVGRTSKATGFVESAVSASTLIKLYQVSGNFVSGEVLEVDGRVVGTIAASNGVFNYQLTDSKQVVCKNQSSTIIMTADLVLNDIQRLSGTDYTINTGTTKIQGGTGSNFAVELRPGDVVYGASTSAYARVTRLNQSAINVGTVFAYTTVPQTASYEATSGITNGTAFTPRRARPYLFVAKENGDLITDMPKQAVRSISDESMIVRRTIDNISVVSQSFATSLSENEQFEPLGRSNHALTVTAISGAGTYAVGDTIDLTAGNTTFNTSGTPRSTITVTGLANATVVRLTAAVSKNVLNRKIKNSIKMTVFKVTKTTFNYINTDAAKYGLSYSNLYGTRIQDYEISLGIPDVYKLHAVYESTDDAVPRVPSCILVESTFFATGSIINGTVSGARARVVDFNSSTLKLSYIPLNNTSFNLGETITGVNLNGENISALLSDADGSIDAGSKNITSYYELDPNQNGFFYNISKIRRFSNAPAPVRQLLVVFDYFSHESSGDYFSAQSYVGLDYADIPEFNDKKLRDVLDFRPAVKPLRDVGGAGTIASPFFVNCSSLDFASRLFQTSADPKATVFDIPKPDTDFRCDYSYYLSRIDRLYLTSEGEFKPVLGKSAENPNVPDVLNNAMLLGILIHKPYGFDPERDVIFKKEDNRRYTMRDIGTIERRLNQVEYYTSLSLLEADTNSMRITDDDNNDKLKNGYVVDDFTSHNIGDVNSTEYKASLDFKNGQLRPSHYTTNVPLEYNSALSTNIQKSGPILSLPFTDELLIKQPYASRQENVNPFNVFAYIGRIDLTPSSDDWIETKRLPARIENVEGDFSSVSRNLNTDQNGFAPIEWNAWETTWTGEKQTGTSTYISHTNLGGGRWLGPTGWFAYVHERRDFTITTNQARTGVRTKVVPRIDNKSLGDSLVSRTTIPYIRSRNIKFEVERLKPKTRVYGFFDENSIEQYCTPKLIELIKNAATDPRTNDIPFSIGETVTGLSSGVKLKVVAPNDGYVYSPYDDSTLPSTYSSQTAYLNIDTEAMATQVNANFYGNIKVGEILQGSSGAKAVVKDRRLISDRKGTLYGTFFIPSPSVDTNPRWPTGTRALRFTTSSVNSYVPGTVDSSADTTYSASGTLDTVQENILAVRNADIVRDTVTDTRTITSTRTEVRQIGWYDPLAQSFLVDKDDGVYVTKAEIYFATRDNNIPISCQIRTMVNGYPSNKILPFSDVTIYPSDVQISENASLATTFRFKAPIYLQKGVEYSLVLLSDSNEYRVWISRMGDIDISGSRTISEQPYAGVLFKSQNATTWTADQYEDLKFNIYRAKFTKSQGTAIFNNAELGIGNNQILNLKENAIKTYKPEQILVLNTTGLTFTPGATIRQVGNAAAQATIKEFNNTTTPNQLVVTDIVGAFNQGTGSPLTYAIRSSSATSTIVLNSAGLTGTFVAGATITGGTSGLIAEVVSWTAGTRTLVVRYLGANSTATNATWTASETISQASPSAASGTISGTPTYAGDTRTAYVSVAPSYPAYSRKITIAHSNHGMHDTLNNVTISGAISEISPTSLKTGISSTDTTLSVVDASAFHKTVAGLSISESNPGYIKIENEILQYSAISADGTTITIKTGGRAAANTIAVAHEQGTVVECYNLDGIPLTEINKTHTEISAPTLDSYDLVTNSVGINGITGGSTQIYATQNVPFEVITPQIQTAIVPKTTISSRLNAVTGTSINDGVTVLTNSFVNDGTLFDVELNTSNYLDKQYLIASKVNENARNNGAKSLLIQTIMQSESEYLSPIIDLDRLSCITTSNRINNLTTDSTATLAVGDPNAAIYITRLARLTIQSKSLKVMFDAWRHPDADIKVLYKVIPAGSTTPEDQIGYKLFNNTGNPDKTVIPTETVQFKSYEYTFSGDAFTAFQVKIIMKSKNQAIVPIIESLRCIALAT